jgi:hypothetical protein
MLICLKMYLHLQSFNKSVATSGDENMSLEYLMHVNQYEKLI